MFKVTKNIWIFGLFKKCTFMEDPRKKRRLGVVESKCIVLMRRIEAAASESGTPGGATLEPHSHTEHTSHSVSERLRPITHLFCSTHGELTDDSHDLTSSARNCHTRYSLNSRWRTSDCRLKPAVQRQNGVIGDSAQSLGTQWVTNWPPVARWALALTRGEPMSKWVPVTRFFDFRGLIVSIMVDVFRF